MNGTVILFFVSCICLSRRLADANQRTEAHSQIQLIRMPPGCSCLDTATTSISSHDSDSFSDCKMFDCSCACDLYPNRCDQDCCCDLDCSQYELLDSPCSEEKDSNGSMLARICFDKDSSLETINVPYKKRIDHSIEVGKFSFLLLMLSICFSILSIVIPLPDCVWFRKNSMVSFVFLLIIAS